MKIRLILLGCAVALVVPAIAKEKDTPLGKQMDAFSDSFKALRREKDPVKGAALTREAEQAVLKALAELPQLVTKMPDGPDKDKASAEYRKMLGQVFVSLCEMEESFVAGKPDEVEKIMANLKDMKKAGHDKFVEDE